MRTSIKIGGLTMTRGNSKMGQVLNLSLPPPKSCDTSLPCFTGGCYAMKSCYNLYPEVRKAWDGNWQVWEEQGFGAYFNGIAESIKKARPALFRWHVGGDIPDERYLDGVVLTATRFPDVRFRVFTKRYLFAMRNREALKIVPNLTVSLSAWPGLYLSPAIQKHFSVSWLRDPKNLDGRIPADAKQCLGKCDICQLCWGLKPHESVVFDKH